MRVHGSRALWGWCDATIRQHGSPLSSRSRHSALVERWSHERRDSPIIWIRGAKRVTEVTVRAKPRPQGMVPPPEEDVPEHVEESISAPMYPTVIQQSLNNMRKFSHCVLLTRVGSFYELYFDQAETYAPLLALKLAKKRTNAGPVAMAGFPYFQLDRFLKMLVQDMKCSVAISEEFPNDAAGKVRTGGLLFDRRVTRVVTPGTLIDEKFMNPWENNFILSIHGQSGGDELGLAWLDLSSGDFFTQTTDIATLSSALATIGPREVVVEQGVESVKGHPLRAVLDEGKITTTYHVATPGWDWNSMIEDDFELEQDRFSAQEIGAGSLLLQYVQTQLQGNLPRLRPPIQKRHNAQMMIDKNSIKALEIKQTIRDGMYDGSLLHSVRKTETKGGTRLLCQRLLAPSTSIAEINERLDLVTELLHHPDLREDVVMLLKATFDSWRLLQKLSFGRGDADDLIGVARTIQLTVQIHERLDQHVGFLNDEKAETLSAQSSFQSLLRRLAIDEPSAFAEKILSSIDEEILSEQHRLEDESAAAVVDLAESVLSEAGETEPLKGVPRSVRGAQGNEPASKDKDSTQDLWIMRPSASTNLSRLHRELSDLQDEKQALAAQLRADSKAQTLTLKWTPGLGHIGHLKGKTSSTQSALSTVFPGARTVHSTKSTLSFYLPAWTKLGTRIDECKTRIRAEEQTVFANLRSTLIKKHLVTLRKNAAVLDELDVACGFAKLAEERNWTRPVVDESFGCDIIGGRHPTVEPALTSSGRMFTPNDLSLSTSSSTADSTTPSRIILVTGPNMAGKSTFLRQNSLIVLLSHLGSYVPASYARIGLVDALFSRVGSADNLAGEQSTFMVEMLETAHILKHATPRSFVVMDEVGRGTTPEDGVAVGYAVLKHLASKNKSRTLFATHFHGLADMTGDWKEVECWCSDVLEDGDGWSYGHKLRRGVNRESHALKVAKMAGLSEEVVRDAEAVVQMLKIESMGIQSHSQGEREPLKFMSSGTAG
jgi:DNA mismatch repair ATPase MutS